MKLPEPLIRQEQWNRNSTGEIISKAPDFTTYTADQMLQYRLDTLEEAAQLFEPAAALLCSQHAEIEGWKNDQKENLKNQCDLHAEIERLKNVQDMHTALAESHSNVLRECDTLRAEIQKLRSNHERLQKLVDDGSASGLAYTASLALEAENQKLRDALTLALRQNEHDMLMTGDEIRKCEDALGETK